MHIANKYMCDTALSLPWVLSHDYSPFKGRASALLFIFHRIHHIPDTELADYLKKHLIILLLCHFVTQLTEMFPDIYILDCEGRNGGFPLSHAVTVAFSSLWVAQSYGAACFFAFIFVLTLSVKPPKHSTPLTPQLRVHYRHE